MEVTALAGGIGAGKFLRGLVRAVPPEGVQVVVNTADDRRFHGLWVSPDLDSVTYWLAGVMDRERGWGLSGETFRTTEELRELGAPDSWFGLGDLDMATHLFRTQMMSEGRTLSEATHSIADRFGLTCELLPMSDDPVATMIEIPDGRIDFQDYWVRRGASDAVTAVTYSGAEVAVPAPGVIGAIEAADAIVICPSNPIASIFPILEIPGIREALASRSGRVVGVSPIVGGAPVRGMADRLMPAMGYGVSAAEAARCYEGLLAGWVMDERDVELAATIEARGIRVAVTDTMMIDDDASERIARVALGLL
jgi:LPPG:FO 2-phospho-L-lactate transferase